ncbi:MAG: N-acetylmuramoyl-L-alanine amidase [Erysipelotrichaceae bacterium]
MVMVYTPKAKKFKIRWKFAGPFLVLLALIIYMVAQFMITALDDSPPKLTICDFSENKTYDEMSKDYKLTYSTSDYMFYGESFDLLKNPYNPEVNDELVGKTMVFKNLCTGEEYPFSIESSIDRHVALSELSNGYYEVYVIDDMKQKRIVYNQDLKDTSYTTIKRNGKVKEIGLYANKNLLKDYEKKLKDRYLFVEVKDKEANENDYDIVLDPGSFNRDFTYIIDRGVKANGLVEYQENFKAAKRIKSKLEEYGLRVKLTRNHVDDVVDTYGAKGRLSKAYGSNARYYIHIGANSSEFDSIKGMEVYYSGYASPTLANALLYDLKKNTQLSGNATNAVDLSNAGVIESYFIEGKDGRVLYDRDMYIREAGGKATLAAMYSENSEKNNSAFSKDNIHGMYGVSIYYSYFTNKQDAAYWQDNWQKISDETANSIANYLKVNKKEK